MIFVNPAWGSAALSLPDSQRTGSLGTRVADVGLPETDIRLAGLPAEANRFVGRSRELKLLTKLLTRVRLVTLTGVGGTGKTRLALQVARRLRGEFPDGITYIGLGDLQDGELVGQLVADALGLRGAVRRWTAEALAEHLGDSRGLLVFDNCEQVVGACAELIDVLLSSCPALTVLATSREPFAVAGESTFPVLPMEVPGSDCPLDAFAQFDAVGLFVERAQAVVPSFELREQNYESVAELCRMLDGLPLALELAAVRLRALSLQQIAELVAARPELLDVGRRGGPARQRTLSASMGWSYDLCSAPEQLLWTRMSVFSGGVELQAAEGICSDEQLSPAEVLPLLTSLVDKSILIREERGGRVRYRLLQIVRQFGLAVLGADADEVGRWRRRHRDWYLDLVDRTLSDWRPAGQADRLGMLKDDVANLRAALEFCLDNPGESAAGLRMASSLYHYWLLTGLLGEGAYWIDRMLAVSAESGPERIRGLYAAASLSALRGDVTSADRMLDEASSLCDLLGDDAGRAYTMQGRGLMALVVDDTEQASKLLADAMRQFESVDDNAAAAFTTVLYGIVSMLRGESDQVAAAHQRCQAMTVPYGESWIWSFSLWVSGMDAWNRGDLTDAIELLNTALRLKRPLDDHLGIAECLEGIAWVTATSGELRRAAVLQGAADSLWHGMGMSAGTVPGFHRHREESVKLAQRMGKRPFEAACREGRTMSLDESIAFALRESAPSGCAGDAAKPTKREREIAQLVALGRSNQDIADELVLSRRTVEAHVQHLLAKLGFSSRSQVAAWIAYQNAAAVDRQPPHADEPKDVLV
ncbi:ATP-binding protein [Mycolicibacterium komossense]|uniref:LuxR family transcriptional regulator n=1 Tax=Mycolicibacterium komossense TaxID=1779 RepID=A0ABT3CI80_9MYCO|nr:LuxR C-terminal-related transcriptional regulator [Mycolicibacterium komossense]MCV7229209.1 LuxR family transcriptional regulator [Mycolicibacterium komossense]